MLSKVLFLAAFTARSQAYAQAMVAHSFRPEACLLFGDESAGFPGQTERTNPQHAAIGDITLPNLAIPLAKSCGELGSRIERLRVTDVNSVEIRNQVKAFAPSLIIYSGYGKQIIKGSLLELGVPILHVHSGWLPEFRGSTTMYYSLLKERCCGASAILLDAGIDTGPIVARKLYPAPPAGTDIDFLYDPAIRADLLIEALAALGRGCPLTPQEPGGNAGQTFYVIHPVLKHIALLSLPSALQEKGA